ncbi:hypothetical protein GL213_09350 [Halogeometricum borinquense]|uniref:Small CPxCG-related zinc finger protein n=2 Tax=Halogeometricum borinquense TaxID=60847 RepID=E4NNA9_HALBP|nr:hypothetical protein [Halogeometricum borinquense]ADQ67447.1 hypothetical protein Hbor_18800 [Halogeometricum borinquense DSM 11551]ELY23278.1 hypothetical protein C499_19022 [Halogeometricum borinquense DSM 11551]QIB74087.1 hypothetical protein G3I44_07140 [Halogeometricum borinquense]QIQ76706.1 hypothetical protein GL213_09350 [Halogeometricum borinquense]RYJ13574.1 hypothetical protein ELS19_06115 [Halogeometricum borinquense]
MVDPTSNLGEDIDESDAPSCSNCDEPIIQSATHRVVTWVEDEQVKYRHFCSDDCRDEYGE